MPEGAPKKRKSAGPASILEAVGCVGEETPGSAPEDLSEEIAMLRAALRLLHERACANLPLDDLLRVLNGLGRGSTRLAALLKAQQALGESKSAAGALEQALDRVIRELGRE